LVRLVHKTSVNNDEMRQAAVAQGKQRNVLRHLLATHGKSEKNAIFRRNLCLAAFSTRLSLLVPVVALWAWGLAMVITVNPPAVGFLFCFIGTSLIMGWYGYNYWKSRGWMMTWPSLVCILGAVFFLMASLAAEVFVDPAAYFGSGDLDFCGLTGIFFTLDMLPLVFLLFSNDAKLQRSVNKLGAVVGQATRLEELKGTNSKFSPTLKRTLSEEMMLNMGEMERPGLKRDDAGDAGELMAKNPFYSLLGDCYTIVASINTFRFSDLLSATMRTSLTKKKRRNRSLYALSVLFMLAYLTVSAARTSHAHLSLLNIITLVLLDSCHYSIHRGSTYWSPGYGVMLMATARVSIIAFMSNLWIVGYSIAFVIYGGALIRAVVTHRLPRLNQEEAGAVVFLGHDPKGIKCDDIAANPELVLAYTSLYFVLVLVVLAYAEPSGLPTSSITVWGQEWPAYIFTLTGVLVVVSSGLFVACLRSLSLGKQGLLPAKLGAAYMWHPAVRLPTILATATGLSVLCTGLLVWAATGSSATFKVSLCLPAMVLLGRSTYSRWVKNDYELVRWPPDVEKDKAAGIHVAGEEQEDDTPDAAQLAAGMLGDLFSPGDFGASDGGGMKDEGGGKPGIILPEFRPTGDVFTGDIQMPVLPLKSALQRTRAAQQRGAGPGGGGNEGAGLLHNETYDGDGDEGVGAAFAQSEEKALVRPKYVRKQQGDYAAAGAAGDVGREGGAGGQEVGVWITAGVALSRFLDGKGSLGVLCRKCRRRKKIGAFEGDVDGEGDIGEGDVGYGTLPGSDRNGGGNHGDNADEELGEVRVDSLSFRRAFLEGYLLPHEYRACYGFAACLALTVVMGLLLSREHQGWVGHLLWTGVLVVAFTFIPAAKWFGTYEVDTTMKLSLWLAGIILTTTCALTFVLLLDAEAFRDQSLAVLNAFLAYPIVAYSVFSCYQAMDGPTPEKVSSNFDENGDEMEEPPSKCATLYHKTVGRFVSVKALLAVVTALWLWQSFLWGGMYTGCGLAVAVAVVGMVGLIIRDYLSQGSMVSRSNIRVTVRLFADTVMIACLAAALWGVGAEAFCLTVFFVVWILRIALPVATRWLEAEPDTVIYFAPWVFPAYTYDARTGNLVDETHVTRQAFSGLLVGVAWGIVLAIFVEPLGIGVAIACVFMMALASAVAWCVSFSPNRLGVAAQFLDSSLVFEAGDVARSCFVSRHAVFEVECEEFADQTSKGYRGADGRINPASNAARMFEARESAVDLAVGLEEKNKVLRVVLDEETGIYETRSDALYSFGEAVMEAWVSGKGPLGPIGCFGLWFGIMRLFALVGHVCCRKLGAAHNPILARYLPDGQRKDANTLSPPIDHPDILLEILDNESVFRGAFREELMCMMHFQILVLLSAEARLQREASRRGPRLLSGILFRKFLKENHFKLLSNGIVPPNTVFSSASFASVNIPMMAVWLTGLTGEERERFQALRRKFSEIQSDRDRAVIEADEACDKAAAELEKGREARSNKMAAKQRETFARRRAERADAWTEQLAIQDQQMFTSLRAQWLKHDNVTVHPTHKLLREGFEREVLLHGEELETNARESLEDIESQGRGCRPGAYGRKLQYADPDFPPDNSSVGNAQCRQQLASQWKVSLAVNPDIRLFDDGTDPDDVRRGAFADSWLLSALSIISAASVGDGGVDEQIAQLFVSPIGGDGRPVLESYTGAYAVKITVGGKWQQVVIVDDHFPALETSQADDDNKGLAVGHSYGARELWVSLLEKASGTAYAKFFGSYAALETGHVHHALSAFTGAQSEEIFLAGAGRGVGKKSLWKKMTKYKRNGYLLGAGTITGNLVEKQVQDIGLVFGAAYTILDVRDSDGEQLIKLRNPPGDHEEWRGDWGDNSMLWTRRRRARLGLVKNDKDNAFWMSFNDFCVVFRSLYVCRWYDPRRWTRLEQSGSWEMREDLDTAAGLPSAQQKVCELENNPQFVLEVNRITDLKISLIQTDDEVQPAACFVLREDEATPSTQPKRFPARVSRLSKEVVAASTGPPARQRERNIYVTLASGTYVVMCAAFLAGMEGSFKKVEITTNSPQLKFRKLWPPADPNELEKAFDDSKAAGRIANMGLEKLGAMSAELGDKLNDNADKALNKARALEMGLKVAAAREKEERAKEDAELDAEDGRGRQQEQQQRVVENPYP
ncbi:unnamed protein product, partial [Ectocarpus sp. 12 AP-2014]